MELTWGMAKREAYERNSWRKRIFEGVHIKFLKCIPKLTPVSIDLKQI